MRKAAVDYRTFRLSRLNEPQFRHLKLLGGWVVYLTLYGLTEALIPARNCTAVHIRLDDMIPFCEVFVIPYVCWYFLLIISVVWFARYDVKSFCRFQIYLIIVQMIAMAIYILFPTRQDLRPVVFPRDNLLSNLVGILYRLDTNTGVCPSMHVAFSLAMLSVWWRAKDVHRAWQVFITVMAALICLATVFIKQHSALDFFAALPLCLLAELVVFGKWWRQKLRLPKPA